MIVYELQRSPFINKNKNQQQSFVIPGRETMGMEKKNPGKHCKLLKFDFPFVSNRLKCSVAGRCLIGFSLLRNALPNVHYAVRFFLKKSYFNTRCTKPLDFKKTRILFMFQSVHITGDVFTHLSRVSLPLRFLFFSLPGRSSKGIALFFQPSRNAALRSDFLL